MLVLGNIVKVTKLVNQNVTGRLIIRVGVVMRRPVVGCDSGESMIAVG